MQIFIIQFLKKRISKLFVINDKDLDSLTFLTTVIDEYDLNGNIVVSTKPNCISKAKYIIITIGTPVDEYLNHLINIHVYFNEYLII